MMKALPLLAVLFPFVVAGACIAAPFIAIRIYRDKQERAAFAARRLVSTVTPRWVIG